MRVNERKEEHLKRVFGEVLLGQVDLCSVVWFYDHSRDGYARSRGFMIVREDLCSVMAFYARSRTFMLAYRIL